MGILDEDMCGGKNINIKNMTSLILPTELAASPKKLEEFEEKCMSLTPAQRLKFLQKYVVCDTEHILATSRLAPKVPAFPVLIAEGFT
jgi:hypothetical protein